MYENDNLNGIREEWYQNGILKERAEFKDGKLHGLKENFHKNGHLAKQVMYRNGKKVQFEASVNDEICA